MIYDIAIIGGGPAGYNAAERAAESGLQTVLFEKNALGGVCLNEGCIPTKTLLYSAKLLDNAKNAAKYGVKIDGNVAADLEKIVARKNKVVRKLTLGIKAKLTEKGVTIVQGAAFLKSKSGETIEIDCNSETFFAKNVLLCTGSQTFVPPIKGLEKVDFWTSCEALENREIPETLTVIGGGVIGMEFAAFFHSLGTKVTVVEMLSEILGAMDKEISAMLRAEYTKKGIQFHLNTKVIEVDSQTVTIEKENGETEEIAAEKILVSVGRRANFSGIGLENLSIETLKNGVKVNEFMQTSHPNIYAAGDVTGFSLLAHTAVREGEVAVNQILGKIDKMNYAAIPAVVYTNPEIAGVGKTEEELTAKGEKFSVKKLPMAFAGRFVAENEMTNGLCKIIINSQNQIVGCHLIGNPASELIIVAGIAVEKAYTIEEFQKIVFPHPTVGEIIRETLF